MRRQFIGTGQDLSDAFQAAQRHATIVVQYRRSKGLPTCGDDVPTGQKLAALMEEVGEVAKATDPDLRVEKLAELNKELLDVATAATLWAWAVEQEAMLCE